MLFVQGSSQNTNQRRASSCSAAESQYYFRCLMNFLIRMMNLCGARCDSYLYLAAFKYTNTNYVLEQAIKSLSDRRRRATHKGVKSYGCFCLRACLFIHSMGGVYSEESKIFFQAHLFEKTDDDDEEPNLTHIAHTMVGRGKEKGYYCSGIRMLYQLSSFKFE